MKIVAIGGRSGSGKTTVSQHIAATHPGKVEVLTLDNYQKAVDDPTMPKVAGMINWDHPSVILWERLRQDLDALRNGEEVQTTAWTHRSVAGIKEPTTLVPRDVVIIEGYLALHTELIGAFDRGVYLDLDAETSYARRRQARGNDDIESVDDLYHTKILTPMYERYVEPTQTHADAVVDVRGRTAEEVARVVSAIIWR